MNIRDVLPFFDGKKVNLARALGISKAAVGQWPNGELPELHAIRIKYEILPEAFGNAPKQSGRKSKAA
ncbi:MAG TPA: hypothetical protein DHU81_06590 [Hyphomonas sp.]|nr:hypothetical protein [Hyphomonas sp.]